MAQVHILIRSRSDVGLCDNRGTSVAVPRDDAS